MFEPQKVQVTLKLMSLYEVYNVQLLVTGIQGQKQLLSMLAMTFWEMTTLCWWVVAVVEGVVVEKVNGGALHVQRQ